MLTKGVIVASAGDTVCRAPLDPRLAAPLLPVANRPILFHALDSMREAGIADVAIVCCSVTADSIRAAAGVHVAPGITDVAGVYLFGAGALRGARQALGGGADGMGLADVVEHVQQAGGRVHVRPVREWRRYTGDVQDLLEMNRIVLDDL